MSRVTSAALVGVDGALVEVEVRISSQLPRIDIVGLPEASVRESAARVRAATAASGQRFPQNRVTVNLAPASLRKTGAGLDLAIAIGILAADGVVQSDGLERFAFIGELALDGRLRPVRGTLSMVLAVREAGCAHVVVPRASAASAALAPGIEVLEASTLEQVLQALNGGEPLAIAQPPDPGEAPAGTHLCMSDVKGQAAAKRAMVVAAAGGHGVLLQGPPGSGKSMLAQRLPGLLPGLAPDEALDVTRIQCVAGLLGERDAVVHARPFRAPHHSASSAGLLGGGSPPRPGEVSLAHCGVLFLDEIPEFERRVREALRQVLEERRITLARASFSCSFPADFMLVCAANPCPCGWYRSGQRDCRCETIAIDRYRQRISGPLLDRIDLHVWVPGVSWSDLSSSSGGATSVELRASVERSRRRQRERGAACNARLPDNTLDRLAKATPAARAMLGQAMKRARLSARAARRVLRVARTIADLAEREEVGESDLAEALSYRDETSSPI